MCTESGDRFPKDGMRRAFRAAAGEQGTELVEFALVLIPLFSLVFLIMCIAWVIFAKATLQHAVREGCRFAVTGQQIPDIQQRVISNAIGVPKLSTAQIQVQYYAQSNLTTPLTGNSANAGGNLVEVSVSGVVINPLVPAWPGLTAVTLSAAASDIMEAHQ